MASLDSSDEEKHADMLKEAICRDFITDALYQNEDQTGWTQNRATNTESLRIRNAYVRDNDTDGVSAEFSQFVAKHLEQALDKHLSTLEELPSPKPLPIRPPHATGVRLLSNSKHFIQPFGNYDVEITKKHRKCNISSSVYEQDICKLQSAVVDAEHIISMAEVSHWSSRNKKNLFEYKLSKNNQLSLITN